MAQAPRPSSPLKNKSNVNASLNRPTEATAEDFKEISDLFNWFADWVDGQVQPEKFYQFHTSLANLAAAHPTAEEDGWAIIVPSNGNTPYVATFTNGEWVASEVQAPVQYFDTKVARDQAGDGQEGIFYIIKDEKIISLWYNNKYNDFGKDGSNGMDAYEVAVALGYPGTREEWLDSLVGPEGPEGPPGPPGAGFENIPSTANKIAVTDGTGGLNWEDKATGELSPSVNSPTLHSFHIQHLQNLDYRVYAWWSFPEEGTFGSQQNPVVEDVTLANGDATYDRIDLIALNSNGSISVVPGTPSANPEEPSIDLTTQLRGTIVLVGANATEPTGITETIAYAEGAPEEFTAEAHYPVPPASRINVASSNTPISGTQSVEATNVYIYDAVNLTPDENLNPTDYTTLEFKLKNKISIQAITFRVQVHGIKSNGQAVISYLDPAETYGYSPQDLTVQTISLPFVVSSQMKEITRIRFVVFADTADQWGFWLDDVKLLGGNEAPITSNYVTTEEMEAALAEYADKRLSNIAADLSEAEKTAIKNKLGVTSTSIGTKTTEDINDVDINSVSTVHALQPLTIPTYDGSGQSTHPSVIFTPDAPNGYKYWMVHTPYPNEDETKENPSIVASNDRVTWVEPTGVTNPIVPAPTTGFNADPCLFKGKDGKYYIFYQNGMTKMVSSSDLINWTAPIELFDLPDASLSPSVIIVDDKYRMYYVHNTAYELKYIESTEIKTGWNTSNPTTCTVNNLPTGFNNWHVEIRKYYDGFHIFLNANSNNTDHSIFFGKSDNGVDFNLADLPLLKPEAGINWVKTRIYKSSFILLNENKYAVWYAAVSDANSWNIGYTEVSLNSGQPVETTNETLRLQTNINPEALYLTENKIYKGKYLLNASYEVALSDEDSALTASDTVPVFVDYIPYDFILTELFVNVGKEAPDGSKITIDLHKNGISVFSTKPTIDALEFTTATAAVPQVILDGVFAKGDKIEIYITQVGLTVPGKGLKAKML